MPTLLFGIVLSALLSITSLTVVLLRVSPLLTPVQAIAAFFASVFLSVTTVSMLLLILLWQRVPHHSWDTATLVRVSMRQAIFLGSGTVIVILFHTYNLLTWWIALMIYGVFLLVELALQQ